jgi:ribonucleoside-diphosphate reductase alpha chain
MDYGVQFNKLMYERLISGGDITCFSPADVPEMYDAFFNDQEKFAELYVKAERNTKIRKKTYKAIDLFSQFAQERKDTGRIYLMNVDHANTHSPFNESIAPVGAQPLSPLEHWCSATRPQLKRSYEPASTNRYNGDG